MAWGLDTDTFLNAFNHSSSRRGIPKELITDRDTYFGCAVEELKKLVSQLDRQKLEKKAAEPGVTWRFNPPAAPHFRGAHEAMVKASKRATYYGVEFLLYFLPLTNQRSDPRDSVPFTPNHFLHGQMGGQFAAESVEIRVNDGERFRTSFHKYGEDGSKNVFLPLTVDQSGHQRCKC